MLNQMAFFGDSLTDGAANNCTYGLGGSGSWYQLVRDRLANIKGLGPLVSTGIIPCGSNVFAGGNGWGFTGGGDAFTGATTSNAFYKSPYGTAGGSGTLRYGSGSAKIATYTAGLDIFYPNVGFTLYFVDIGGIPSYSTNGGSSWIDVPYTFLNDNKIKKIYIETPVTSGSIVKIRCANAAGTAQSVAPLGIEVFYQTPSTASGLIIHNVAVFGSLLRNLTDTTTSGDPLAFLKPSQIILGSGAISHLPNCGSFIMNINDVNGINNTTTWHNDLTTFKAVAENLGPTGFLSPWECSSGLYNTTSQAGYRAQSKTTAAGFSTPAKVLDFYDLFNARGLGSFSLMSAIGYTPDAIHLSKAGHKEIARYLYWWLRTQFLTDYNGPSDYLVKGKVPSVVYSGKKPSVVYLAGEQISPIPV